MEQLGYVNTDGGRSEAGFKGMAGDCVCRAIAISTDTPYREVYDELFRLGKELGVKSPSPRNHVKRKVWDRYFYYLSDWEWIPTMTIGSGCQVHLRRDELPSGRLFVRLSKHVCAVIDGVVYDNHDPRRDGTRCVYGYYRKVK